jgi:hypothetical protein
MSDYLRYSTEAGFLAPTDPTPVVLGPFVSDVDGKTPVTGLSFIEADLQVLKVNQFDRYNPYRYPQYIAFVKSETADPWYSDLGNGMYVFWGHDSNTDIIGQLVINVNKTGALPYKKTFEVRFQFNANNNFDHGDVCDVKLYPALVWSGENRVIGIKESDDYKLGTITINGEDVSSKVLRTSNQDYTSLLGCSNITREEWVETSFIAR